jgi:hypothetical protein
MKMSSKKKAKPGDAVVLIKVPPGLLRGLPREDQRAISKIVGKPIIFAGYDDDGRAELEFWETDHVGHSIFVNPKFVRPAHSENRSTKRKKTRRRAKSNKPKTKN